MKIFLFLLSVPLQAQAIFTQIYEGYKTSDRLKVIKFDEDIISANLEFGKNKYDWNLNMGTSHSNSFLQSLFSFQSQQTISNSFTLGLKKQTFGYGTFSLEHQEVNYDLSNWASSSLSSFSDDSVYESKNNFTYSYDFLNDSLEKDWDILLTENAVDKISYNQTLQKDYYDFFLAYLNAKQRIMLDRLYKDFERRAIKRVKLVKKRVSDGLSRKHELNQAKLSLLSQEETILRNTSLLREKIVIIENIVNRKISKDEYVLVNWTFKPIEKFDFLNTNYRFLDLERLKEVNKLTELNLERVNEDINHSLSLNLGYTKNSVNEDKSEALSDSLGSGNNDEKLVSLVYTIPIGGKRVNSHKKKLLLQRNKNELSYSNKKNELNIQVSVLKENINRYAQAASLLVRKIKVANGSLKEHQKLYLRGHVSFEELIRAEETLINAKISQMNMYALYEQSLSQFAYLSGKIVTFLNNYTD